MDVFLMAGVHQQPEHWLAVKLPGWRSNL